MKLFLFITILNCLAYAATVICAALAAGLTSKARPSSIARSATDGSATEVRKPKPPFPSLPSVKIRVSVHRGMIRLTPLGVNS